MLKLNTVLTSFYSVKNDMTGNVLTGRVIEVTDDRYTIQFTYNNHPKYDHSEEYGAHDTYRHREHYEITEPPCLPEELFEL